MTININDETIQSEKLALILEKKENLKTKIESSEKRIDEKLASLVADGFISNEINLEAAMEKVNASLKDPHQDDIFSNIDLSDDDALDQAVRTAKPASRLAFTSEDPFDPFEPPLPLDTHKEDDTIPDDTIPDDIIPDDIIPDDIIPDDEIPTISKVLGRSLDFDKETVDLDFDQTHSQTKVIDKIDKAKETTPPAAQQTAPITPPLTESKTEEAAPKRKKDPKKPSPKKTDLNRVYKAKAKPQSKDMILPSFLFILGLISCGVFLVGFSANFNFIDYSVLFILLTCMIFTIALPYAVSLFFMLLITVGYGILIIISTLYFKIPFSGYQFAWLLIIPLILFGNILLIKRIRELYHFKKDLEAQINAYDVMDQTLGLTTEKAYYKDLKDAMDRASANEIILVVEMISISHLDTLQAMNGPRIWDEILYKTLKIIKKHSYSTHLIYVLEGNVFSIIMENTSMKNQLMINQSIRNDFEALIAEFEMIDVPVSLKIASIPYSREISNPFDYRALGFKHLDH